MLIYQQIEIVRLDPGLPGELEFEINGIARIPAHTQDVLMLNNICLLEILFLGTLDLWENYRIPVSRLA